MIAKLVAASLLIGVCLGANKPTHDIQFPEKGTPCIMIDFSSNNSLMFNSQTIPDWDFSNITIVNKESMCANGTDEAKLKIRFHADNATYTFFFNKNNNGSVSIKMELEFIPNNVFKNNITDSVQINTSIADTFQDTMSYACKSETYTGQVMDVKNNTYKLTMRFMDVQMQAYNLDNGKFSTPKHCASDQETTTMSTETTPMSTETTPMSTETTPMSTETTPMSTKTTPMSTETNPVSSETTPMTTEPLTTPEMTTPSADPNRHTSFDGTVIRTDNTTCIHLKTEMLLIFNYVMDDKTNGTAKIGVQNPTVSGNCSDAGQRIRLDFLKDFTIEIMFAKDDSNIYWNTVNVMGKYTEEFFPKAANMNMSFNFPNISLSEQFKAKLDGSYMCNSDTSTALIDGLTLETWNMQYTAFQKDATKFSDDDVSECSADSKTSSIVPIAVGAALAGLVVIVLIAYLIGRRRNRKGYDEM